MNFKKAPLIISALLSVGLLSANAMAEDMMHKHNLPCNTCHGKQIGSPVSADQCRQCHKNLYKEGPILKNGEANPHVSIHYEPKTVDCSNCHQEHKPSKNYCTACHADGLGFKVP